MYGNYTSNYLLRQILMGWQTRFGTLKPNIQHPEVKPNQAKHPQLDFQK